MNMIVGIDEVGRGSWAGPVVAAAVLFNGPPVLGLTDSKLLSRIARARLKIKIIAAKSHIGIGWVSAQELDEFGLTNAVGEAMRRALAQIKEPYETIIIDGNYNFLSDNPVSTTRVQADLHIAEVSAASIIAKQARDDYMIQQAIEHPGFGFERHMGYGTAEHKDAIHRLGICTLHRKSFKPIRELA